MSGITQPDEGQEATMDTQIKRKITNLRTGAQASLAQASAHLEYGEYVQAQSLIELALREVNQAWAIEVEASQSLASVA